MSIFSSPLFTCHVSHLYSSMRLVRVSPASCTSKIQWQWMGQTSVTLRSLSVSVQQCWKRVEEQATCSTGQGKQDKHKCNRRKYQGPTTSTEGENLATQDTRSAASNLIHVWENHFCNKCLLVPKVMHLYTVVWRRKSTCLFPVCVWLSCPCRSKLEAESWWPLHLAGKHTTEPGILLHAQSSQLHADPLLLLPWHVRVYGTCITPKPCSWLKRDSLHTLGHLVYTLYILQHPGLHILL